MKVNVTKSTKGKFSNLEAGTVLHVSSTYHGLSDSVLMVVNMMDGNNFTLINLEKGMKWEVLDEGRIPTIISQVGLTETINQLQASGKYDFTEVKAELNVEV